MPRLYKSWLPYYMESSPNFNFFLIIFGVSSKYLIKKIREVHIIAAIQYNRS